MEEEGMKITVVGAALIVLAVIAAIWLIRHWQNKGDQGPEQLQ